MATAGYVCHRIALWAWSLYSCWYANDMHAYANDVECCASRRGYRFVSAMIG